LLDTARLETEPFSLAVAMPSDRSRYAWRGAADDELRTRPAAALATIRPRTGTRLAFGQGYPSEALHDRLSDALRPAFIAAHEPNASDNLRHLGPTSMAIEQAFYGARVTAAVELGRTATPLDGKSSYSVASLKVEKQFGAMNLLLGGSRLLERETVLGSTLGPLTAIAQSITTFADLRGEVELGSDWRMSAAYRRGWTSVSGRSALTRTGRLDSDALSFDLAKPGLVAAADFFAVRVAQPLRVRSGALRLLVPVSYDYADRQVTFGPRDLSLAPIGRELAFEASYRRPMFDGFVTLNGYVRTNAGNVAAARNDAGVLIRYTTR